MNTLQADADFELGTAQMILKKFTRLRLEPEGLWWT